MECIISKFNTPIEILKSSSTYNFAWQKSGVGHGPPGPPSFAGPEYTILNPRHSVKATKPTFGNLITKRGQEREIPIQKKNTAKLFH